MVVVYLWKPKIESPGTRRDVSVRDRNAVVGLAPKQRSPPKIQASGISSQSRSMPIGTCGNRNGMVPATVAVYFAS
jgi:hypothetical protein